MSPWSGAGPAKPKTGVTRVLYDYDTRADDFLHNATRLHKRRKRTLVIVYGVAWRVYNGQAYR